MVAYQVVQSPSGRRNLLTSMVGFVSKYLILFLCVNLFVFSANHVVCMELSGKAVVEYQGQLYECCYPHHQVSSCRQRQNHSPSQGVTSLLGANPVCPDCVDEHIQYLDSSTWVDLLPAAVLLPTPARTYACFNFQHLVPALGAVAFQLSPSQPSSFTISEISNTVLLI